jgi:hypothetical protein
VYSFAQRDVVIVLANGISLLLWLAFFISNGDRKAAARRQLKNDIVCPTFFTLAARY